MSMTDIPEAADSFERTPPQDVGAEQSVVGGMLMSKDAIADVVETLRGNDFYRPAHEVIYDAILDLYGRGEPADAVTVAAELTRRGELARIGGAPYLHTLLSSVPTAANAGYYARIVRERAVLRRLVDAGTRIAQLGYAADGGDVDELVNTAQSEVYAVTERRTAEDYVPLKDVINSTIEEIDSNTHRGEGMVGVPTGFADLDALTNGLHPGQMIVLAARPAVGKALALETPLPTPSGWTTMGEVQVGDELIAADGTATPVIAATEVMQDRPCYEVTFDDGTSMIADAQHQWLTDTRASRKSAQAAAVQYNRYRNQRTFAEVRTTEELARTVRCETVEQRLNHCVQNSQAIQLPQAELPIDPYVLGVWLGDGHSAAARFTSDDPEMAMRIEGRGYEVHPGSGRTSTILMPSEDRPQRACVVCGAMFTPQTPQVKTCGRSCGGRAKGMGGYSVSPTCPDCDGPTSGLRRCADCHADHGTVQALLRNMSLLHDKHIPAFYLRASEQQRRDLLAGLLDTDGTVSPSGAVQFTSTNVRLAQDARELIHSLGYRTGWSERAVAGRTWQTSTAMTVTFTTDDPVFALERKRIRHKERRHGATPRRHARFVTSVRGVASVPVRCVEIGHSSHLYLASRAMIPTHNSTLGLDIARAASMRNGMTSVIFSLEMSRNEISMRMLSAESQVPLQNMRKGNMRDEDWTRLARAMGKVSEAPLFIDDSPNMSLMEIRAKCRRLKQRHDLKLVVIDYLQLMSSGKRVESRQQEVSEFSRAMKLLAKELEVPVIAISQLNRGSEQRTDKKPQMSDLRESGCLTADTTVLRADTGAEVTMGQLLADDVRDVPVWALDDRLKYVRRHLTHVFSTGVKPVYRLTLSSGKQVRATANHPFLTYGGWTPLGELEVGSRVGVPRHVPAPACCDSSRTDRQVVATARALSTEGDPPSVFPEWVFQLPKRQIALFLRAWWSAAGSVGRHGVAAPAQTVDAASALCRLLLRFGISTIVTAAGTVVSVSGGDDVRRFLQEIGVDGGAQSASAEALLHRVRLEQEGGSMTAADLPVWDEVRLAMSARCASAEAAQMPAVATLLADDGLELEAVNDVLWDTVTGITYEGVEEVFDATVAGSHNFIANGIAVHNSIEQDADVVILLHREDLYEKESPRAGEADIIVAKHRNGPTDNIVVAFQGHYARFFDMAQ